MAQTETETSITPRQDKAITALLSAPTVERAAETAGVGRSTLHRWLIQAEFREELTRRRDAIVDAAMDTFKVYVCRAVDTLAKLLDSENEKLRRLAAKDILEYVFRVRELQDIERRVTKLEATSRNE